MRAVFWVIAHAASGQMLVFTAWEDLELSDQKANCISKLY